jgi:hypothetical protein
MPSCAKESPANSLMKEALLSIFGFERKAPLWFAALVVGAVIAFGWWFATAAIQHGKEKNTVPEYNDQRVYMNAARVMRETNYSTFTARMRMPLYMWILSPVATKWQLIEDFFPTARVFNIFWTLGLLVSLYFVARTRMGNWLALAFCLMAAGQFYVLKAAYVQPELTLATVIVITCFQLVETLQRPTHKNALISGLLLCVWFLTKASAQIALGLFGLMLGVKFLFAGRGKRMPYITAGLITLAAYVTPMSPYLWNSYKVFGDPFYNVQGKHYMWASVADKETVDRKEDEKHWLQGLGIETSLANLKPEDKERLPTAAKYFREHSLQSIQDRLLKGMDMMFTMAFNDYAALHYFIALWCGLTLFLLTWRWEKTVHGFFRWFWEIIYVVVLLCSFCVLYGWFVPLQVGPRLLLSVTLVVPAFCMAIAYQWLRDAPLKIGGTRLAWDKIVATLFILLWARVTWVQAPSDLMMSFYGG